MKVKITVGVVLAAIVIAAILIFFPRKTAPEVRFTALRGEVALVNFWATYKDSSGEAAKRFGNVRFTPMSFLIDA